jgi:Tol biopolymer transport system component/predicted Ser/Thr protein kinase
MIGQTISHYRITEKLGEGGMGVVYKAEDTNLKRPVALKFLAAHLLGDEEIKARFRREAEAAAALNHPNVCHVYEIGEVEGKTFIAMAFLEGEGLDKKIEAGPLTLKDSLDIAIQTAHGLQAAHDKKIVHRDVKPANLMITGSGAKQHVTIMDFGLAQLADRSKLTRLDETMGTVTYMSPEQTYGADIDHRSDIWSLGVVIYEMVTGQQPFKGHYDKAVMYSITSEEPEPMTALRTGVPMELELLVNKCLAKGQDDRYQHTDELLLDLRTLQKKLESGKSAIVRPTALPGATQTKTDGESAKELATPVAAMQKAGARAASRGGEFVAWALVAVVSVIAVLLGAMLWLQEPREQRLVRRFSFTPDPLVSAGSRRPAAISPDGRRIVYYAGSEVRQLFIHDIEHGESRPLAGTEGARGAFWSPDSASIAFGVRNGNLSKVSVDGGPTVTICPVPDAGISGGTWSPDGKTIVFGSGTVTHALYEVPASGGSPRKLEQIAGVKGGTNRSPHFLPASGSGRALLLAVGHGWNQDIHLMKLDTGESVKLVEGSHPAYSSSGHILYQTAPLRGGLWALPFSAETLEVTGEAFPIAEGLGGPTVAADGTLVAVDVFEPQGREQLVWRDRTGTRLGSIGQPQARMGRPTLSPDGRRVAVAASETPDVLEIDIWIHDVERPIKRRLVHDAAPQDHPFWSPDGEEIVFRTRGQGSGDLFTRRADGSGEARPLVESEFRETEPEWSRDGRFLVYQVTRPGGLFDLRYLRRSESGEGFESLPFLETEFNETHPAFSPDGRLLAYASRESGRGQVYVRKFPEGDLVGQVSEDGGNAPRWSADGREIYWVAGDTLMAAAVNIDGGFRVGPIQKLFADPTLRLGTRQYDVAADGRFVTIERLEPEGEAAEERERSIHIVQNWYEEFRDRE